MHALARIPRVALFHNKPKDLNRSLLPKSIVSRHIRQERPFFLVGALSTAEIVPLWCDDQGSKPRYLGIVV